MKRNLLVAFAFALLGIGCDSDESSVFVNANPVTMDQFELGNVSLDSLDDENREIFVTPKKGFSDSIVFKDLKKVLEISGGNAAYRALSDNEYDPDIVDWDSPLEEGKAISFYGSDSLTIVVLDSTNSVTDIWKIILFGRPSSSSTKISSSSSMKVSSGSSKKESSSSKKESSSSKKEKTNSCSSIADEKSGTSSKKAENVSSGSSSDSSDKEVSSESGRGNGNSSIGSEVDSSSENVKDDSSSSVIEENSSSSSVISGSSEGAVESSSSKENVTHSSEKNIESFQIWVSGTRLTSAEKDASSKTISLKLATVNAIDSVQMYRLTLSEGAVSDISLKKDLKFTKSGNYTYEYCFTVTAEDGSSDSWKIVATVPKGVALKDFAVDVDDSRITITGNKIYVELPYDSTLDMTALNVLPMDTNANLVSPTEMEFVDDNDELQTYTVVAGMQLPGTKFNSLNLDFWGTTSNAMGVSATVADIKVSSTENLALDNPGITLTSKTLLGETGILGVDGSKKLAGGFYFVGSYSGISAMNLYDRTNSGGTPSLSASDASKDMTFGRSFKCRPVSFTVDYSYSHENNSNESYPQKFLIYVLLVSADNYVVAGGVVTGNASVSSISKEVPLTYGFDVKNLDKYPVSSSIKGSDASKEVAYIQVMFASSAYAHVVAGGTTWLNDPTKDFRGGDGASLSIKSFRLNY